MKNSAFPVAGSDGGDADEKWVSAYLRVSNQQSDTQSIEIQKAQIDSFLSKNPNLKLFRYYVDDGISGAKLSRPGLDELLNDGRQKKFSVVLVAKMDRLARDLYIQLFLEKELALQKVQLISISEAVNGEGALVSAMRHVVAIFASLEREKIKERLLAGRQIKLKAGKYAGGRLALGYISENSELKVDMHDAQIVRAIRKLRMARLSYARIAQKLNAEGFKSKNGKPFGPSTIFYVMKNPIYRGLIRYGETREGTHEQIR